jgi:Uma2 family endonuclease
MPSAAPNIFRRHRLTVTEYHRMGEAGILSPDAHVELVEGEIIDTAPIGSPHAGTVKYLGNKIKAAVGDRAVVSIQDPVFLDMYSEPHPDIALLRPRRDFYRSAHPTPADILLIIEVADTSLAYDTQIKLPLYALHGIQEVRLADLPGRRFLVHRTPSPTGFRDVQTLTDLTAVTLLLFPEVSMNLSDVF